MEEYIWIIWLVMIIGGALLNSRKKRQAEEVNQELDSEEMPQGTPSEQKPRTLTPQEMLMAKLEALRAAQRRQAALAAQQKAQKAAAQQPKPQPKETKPQIKPSVAARLKGETEEQHELLRDFSAEKAVLYSEILKPKYLDYE